MSVVVVATIRPVPEHREAVIAAFVHEIPAVHEEPGCELYALHQLEDRLVMIEQWESAEALAAHAKGEVIARLNVANDGKLEGRPEVLVLNAVPAGDPNKGLLRA